VRERLVTLGAVAQAQSRPRLACDPLLAEVRQDGHVPRKGSLAVATVATRQSPDYDQEHGIEMLAEEGWLLHQWEP
jgi:hypothetical protein